MTARSLRAYRWVGGKGWLLEQLEAQIPADWSGRLVVGFTGGAALFFHLARQGRLDSAALCDINPVIIGVLHNIRRNCDDLSAELEGYRVRLAGGEDVFDSVKALFNHAIVGERAGLFSEGRAPDHVSLQTSAMFLTLNALCYNGLYRVNQSGAFNVARDPARGARHLPSVDRLRECSEALQCARLVHGSYDSVRVSPGDIRYDDPPYIGTFNAYSAASFGPAEQRRLADFQAAEHARGALVITSNSAEQQVLDCYQDWSVKTVFRSNTVSAGSDRGKVPEVLVTSSTPGEVLLRCGRTHVAQTPPGWFVTRGSESLRHGQHFTDEQLARAAATTAEHRLYQVLEGGDWRLHPHTPPSPRA